MDGQFGRTVGYTGAGGADLGEAWATAHTVKAGDVNSWHDAWLRLGDRLYDAAEASCRAGQRASARAAFLRASNYYRNAYIFFFAPPLDPRVVTAYGKQKDAFEQALTQFDTPTESVRIPYEGTTLPGYFFHASASREPRPLLMITGGYDGTAEETYFATGAAALQRGYNVLTFDGPGQGGALVQQQLYMRPDWEKVITPAVDYSVARSDVDAKRIALLGRSFGGYLAPRAAAYEHRLAACIADAALYDLGAGARAMVGETLWSMIERNRAAILKIVFGMVMHNPDSRFSLNRGMFVHNKPTPWAYLLALSDYSLADCAPNIQCPTFLSEAENDSRRGGGVQLYDKLTCPKKYVLFKAADGAGDHCEAGADSLFAQVVFDWLDPILKP